MTVKTGKLGVAAAVLAVLVAAGCQSVGSRVSPSAPTSTADPARRFGCLTEEQNRTGSINVPAVSGVRPGYFQQSDAGTAKVALFFSHQLGGSICDWVPYLKAFTAAGYAVLATEEPGSPARDVPAALTWLGGKGITRAVLIGASKGGTGSLEAAAERSTPLPVAAVVSLSGPANYEGDRALVAVAKIKAPVFFAAEEDDSPFAGDAKDLYATSVSPAKTLKIYPGSRHGADLLADGALNDVLAFLAQNVPAQ
ncbi:alpha/beta hydrolase [Kitasatospora sp. NPDC059722]|uniref:alpha/beta hydrolase n=1 Tax=Kitasatospora sp. NPDC059722 TaxID=3346925 RepID=UPI0036AF19DE